jgi:hypothetical protein
MNPIFNRVSPFALLLLLSGPALAQEQPAPPPQAPAQGAAQPSDAPPAPPAPPPAPPQEQPQAAQDQAPPPPAQWVYSYPSGQWVFTSQDGWIWVPAGTSSAPVDGVPYSYLYTPGFGWNWYISPWGEGAYRYGVWVRHPWRPVGWHGGWVAGPHVFVRLGGHAAFRGRVVVHAGGGGGHVEVREVRGGARGGGRGGGGGHRR